MAKNQDRQAQAMQYMQLLQSGVPAAEAFKQAYPSGIPTQAQQAAQESKDRQKGQLLSTGGTIGGLLAAKYGMDYLSSLKNTAPSTTASAGSTVASGGGGASYGGAASSGASPIGTAADGSTMMSDGTTAASNALEAPTGVSGSVVQTDTLPPGSQVTTDGSIINSSTGATIGKVAQGVGGAYQIYAGVKDFKNDKVGGGLGVLAGGANVGAALGSETVGQFAGPLTALKGGYDTFKGFQNGGEGIRSGTTELGAGIGTMMLPGLGTVAGAVGGNIVGYGLQGSGFKNNLALGAMTGGIGLIPGVGDKIRGLIHKTTRQTAQEHSQQLMKDAGDDQVAQNYVAGMRQQFNTAPKGPAFNGGQFETFDEYRKAGLDPKDLSGVYGNMKTFGASEWANLSQDQRESVTQGLIGADLYRSKKGEVEVTDTDKAKQIYATILGQNQAPQAQPQVVRNTPAPVNPAFASKQIAQTGAFGNQLLQALNSNNKKK